MSLGAYNICYRYRVREKVPARGVERFEYSAVHNAGPNPVEDSEVSLAVRESTKVVVEVVVRSAADPERVFGRMPDGS